MPIAILGPQPKRVDEISGLDKRARLLAYSIDRVASTVGLVADLIITKIIDSKL